MHMYTHTECAPHYEGGDVVRMALPLLQREGCISSCKLSLFMHKEFLNNILNDSEPWCLQQLRNAELVN